MVMEGTEILKLIENAVYWSLERWMSEISAAIKNSNYRNSTLPISLWTHLPPLLGACGCTAGAAGRGPKQSTTAQ